MLHKLGGALKVDLSTVCLSRSHVHQYSIAPNAGQDEAGRSDFPHFAIWAARGEDAENTENADCLSFPNKNRDLRKSVARTTRRTRSGKSENADGKSAENAEKAYDWPYDDWP